MRSTALLPPWAAGLIGLSAFLAALEAGVALGAINGFVIPPPSALPSTTFRVRETEVLLRDDGAGNPVWKIWHHHCSVHAPDDQIRTGFQDSVLTRQKGR